MSITATLSFPGNRTQTAPVMTMHRTTSCTSARPVVVSDIRQALHVYRVEGPLVDLCTAADLLGLSRSMIKLMWRQSALCGFVILGRRLWRLQDVLDYSETRRGCCGRRTSP